MEKEISSLARSSNYTQAKELRGRLTRIRSEFDFLQTDGVALSNKDQLRDFDKAEKELLKNVKREQNEDKRKMAEYCEMKRQDQKNSHQIQCDKLELELSKIPRPAMRFKKRTQELIKAENGLIRLNQYDEAVKVHYMLDRIVPNETKLFYENFDESLEKRRINLSKDHANDIIRLEEKLKGLEWNGVRRRDNESAICNMRINNHSKDMIHAQIKESKLKPEMSVKPSLLWQKRTGHQATSSLLRGSQLLDTVRGKKEGEHVFAQSLVDKHAFDGNLLNTWELPQSS